MWNTHLNNFNVIYLKIKKNDLFEYSFHRIQLLENCTIFILLTVSRTKFYQYDTKSKILTLEKILNNFAHNYKNCSTVWGV